MKSKKESGEVVIEASIVVTLVVIVISIMLYVGMVLYQQTAIAVVANRTATNISQVYSNALRDPFTGYLDSDNAYQSITYSNMKTDAYLDSLKQKGSTFVSYRLKKSQIIPEIDRNVEIEIINKPNEILKKQIVVTITDSYDVPLVGLFNVDGKVSFTASGRADCVDYLEYIFGVEAIANPEDSPIPSLPDSDTCIVTFVKDKYSGGFHAAIPVLRGKTILTSNKHSHSTMPQNPSFSDRKFIGWVTEDGRNFSASVQVNKNITVYGLWRCTITFNPMGGTVNPKTKTVEYMKTTTLPTPERAGYAFEGWYTQKNGGGIKYTSRVTEINGDVTLYAKWRCIHAQFTHKMLDAGNCSTKSTWLHECKTCDYSYKDRGGYGSCEKGTNTTAISPSCTTPGIYVANCKFCNKLMGQGEIAPLGHFSGQCNVTHTFNYPRQLHLHADGSKTGHGRCIVCARCGIPKYNEVTGDTTWNGSFGYYYGCYNITWGQYCYSHGENWSSIPVINIH